MPAPSRPKDAAFLRLTEGRRVFGGMLSRWKDAPASWQDYYTQEELRQGGCVHYAQAQLLCCLSVKAAGCRGQLHEQRIPSLECQLGEWPGTLGGARCLVAGFGRIGKALCGMLQGMGAQVFCAARKPAHWAAIRVLSSSPAARGDSFPGREGASIMRRPSCCAGNVSECIRD